MPKFERLAGFCRTLAGSAPLKAGALWLGSLLFVVGWLPSPKALAQQPPVDFQSSQPSIAQDADPKTTAEKIEAYMAARRAFEDEKISYWTRVAAKRIKRLEKLGRRQALIAEDYELAQPPVYSGPPNPKPVERDETKPELSKYIPVVADFLEASRDNFQFAPDQPLTDAMFKKAYARAAAAAGLSKDQIVRIYAFETGGNGTFDVQAGLENRASPNARAISTAIGYNQLLHVNTVELLAEKGDRFVSALKKKVERALPTERASIKTKLAVLLRMIEFARSVPDEWAAHEKLANAGAGLGVHALNLDADIGPLLQVEVLVTSLVFAKRRGISRTLTGAELEMMNLTGDGNGFDMIAMPILLRSQVPTSNFFQPAGYERNPVAIRNNTVESLLAATNRQMDRASEAPGARELANLFDTVTGR
jgi:hypothetical protein